MDVLPLSLYCPSVHNYYQKIIYFVNITSVTHLGLPIKLSIALSFQKKLSFLVFQVKLETLLLKNMERKFNLSFFEILLIIIMSHFYSLFHGMTRI
jgi:hypothetical protein